METRKVYFQFGDRQPIAITEIGNGETFTFSLGDATNKFEFTDGHERMSIFVDNEDVVCYNSPDAQLNKSEISLIVAGSSLAAVRAVKDRLGVGLKEAKDIVDVYRNKL